MKRFLGIEEISEYLGVNKKTLYSWVWRGAIPYYKFCRLVKFDLKEIEEWIKKSKKLDKST